MTPLTFFQVIPEFTAQSRNGAKCSLSNRDRSRPDLGKSEREIDHFVLRGPMIDHEGYFDIVPTVIYETAHQLGMVYEDQHQEALDEVERLSEEKGRLLEEKAALQRKFAQLEELYRDSVSEQGSYGLYEDLEAEETGTLL